MAMEQNDLTDLRAQISALTTTIQNLSNSDRPDRDLLLVLRIKLENIEHLIEDFKEEHDADIKEIKIQRVEDIKEIKKDVDDRFDDFDKKYVTKEAFTPVSKLTYGFVALILLGVVIAVLKLIGINPNG